MTRHNNLQVMIHQDGSVSTDSFCSQLPLCCQTSCFRQTAATWSGKEVLHPIRCLHTACVYTCTFACTVIQSSPTQRRRHSPAISSIEGDISREDQPSLRQEVVEGENCMDAPQLGQLRQRWRGKAAKGDNHLLLFLFQEVNSL